MTMRKMSTENTILLPGTLSRPSVHGDLGGSIIFTDIGSDAKVMEQSLTTIEQTANKTLLSWFQPHLSAADLYRSSRPDAILVLLLNLRVWLQTRPDLIRFGHPRCRLVR